MRKGLLFLLVLAALLLVIAAKKQTDEDLVRKIASKTLVGNPRLQNLVKKGAALADDIRSKIKSAAKDAVKHTVLGQKKKVLDTQRFVYDALSEVPPMEPGTTVTVEDEQGQDVSAPTTTTSTRGGKLKTLAEQVMARLKEKVRAQKDKAEKTSAPSTTSTKVQLEK